MRLSVLDRFNKQLEQRNGRTLEPDEAKAIKLLRQHLSEELQHPTHIAVIGKCGVGKTSTINALFGTDWKISHVRAATKTVQEFLYESERGRLKISDLPGLGEDIETEDHYREMYAGVLKQCEIALFVLKADSRDMLEVQRILRDVITKANPEVAKRIVIGLNQVDLVHPGSWIEAANLPSEEQETNIRQIAKERLRSLRKVCRITPRQLVPYSATKRYRLEHLFHAMISASGGEAWVLDAKKQISDWRELVDARFLPPESERRG